MFLEARGQIIEENGAEECHDYLLWLQEVSWGSKIGAYSLGRKPIDPAQGSIYCFFALSRGALPEVYGLAAGRGFVKDFERNSFG